MIFGTSTKLARIPQPVSLQIPGGLYLDPVLNWREHVYHTSTKIGSRLGLLSRLKRSALPLNTIKLLANSLALPLFNYCSVAWSNCSNITKDVLVKQRKGMARIALGVDTRTSTDFVLSQLNWTTMEQRWKLQRCKMVYTSLNGQAPEYLNT